MPWDNLVHCAAALLAMLHGPVCSSLAQYMDCLPAVCKVLSVDSELKTFFRNSASWSLSLVREMRQAHEELIQRIKGNAAEKMV